MKKVILVAVSFVIVSVASSCKSHERCAAYGKINKINTGKTFADKSVRAI